jgi:hypothetical protein
VYPHSRLDPFSRICSNIYHYSLGNDPNAYRCICRCHTTLYLEDCYLLTKCWHLLFSFHHDSRVLYRLPIHTMPPYGIPQQPYLHLGACLYSSEPYFLLSPTFTIPQNGTRFLRSLPTYIKLFLLSIQRHTGVF